MHRLGTLGDALEEETNTSLMGTNLNSVLLEEDGDTQSEKAAHAEDLVQLRNLRFFPWSFVVCLMLLYDELYMDRVDGGGKI